MSSPEHEDRRADDPVSRDSERPTVAYVGGTGCGHARKRLRAFSLDNGLFVHEVW